MHYVTLGKTGLRASVLGLGGGGHSRLGHAAGASRSESVAIVRRALELGVNFVDTAEAYGTEEIIGEALQLTNRHSVILSSKKSMTEDDRPITAVALTQGLEASLVRLRTDYIDVYHLHGVQGDQYDHAVEVLVPAMLKLREQGKIRFLGITEAFVSDPGHEMMARAVHDEYWDVVMAGFNMLNQSARNRVFVETTRRGTGVLCMFAVRDALSKPEKLRETVADLVLAGAIGARSIDRDDPLGFVTRVAGVTGLPDAAYRFCRAEPGIHVVLSGTGNIRHLEQNIAAILQPPLPDSAYRQIVDLFAGVDTVSGQ
jgi:aryl-alcohol dehydrogenase-like predicted oxidoreductase